MNGAKAESVLSKKTWSPHPKLKGISLVLIGATLWGVSGTVAQYVFQEKGFSSQWLVDVRLLLSGILLLFISVLQGNENVWMIWKDKRDRWSLLLFGIFGMLGVQYTYFAAIEAGNAATATLLQYLGPVFITCYIALRNRRFPAKLELAAIALALAGTFLLVTKGSFQELSISQSAFFWGGGSALTLAFYTLQPIHLLKKWGSTIVVGWGMLLGGIAFSFVRAPWEMQGQWSIHSVLAILFVVLFGTLIAFYCYLESLKYISAAQTSLLACAEPLSAALLSVLWLHVPFGLTDWFGASCIIMTIVILSYSKR